MDEAQKHLDRYRKEHGERVRGAVVEKVVQEVKKDAHHFLDHIDVPALLLVLVIELVLNVVVFMTIAPDTITKIGMIGLAVLVVLFGLRGWIKGGWAGKGLWALFALVVLFSDISFALYATDVQSATAEDTELARLTDEATKAGAYLEALQSRQLEKGQGYAQQILDAREALGKANEARSSYVSRSHEKFVALTADGLFQAIPDAVKRGRWIELCFFTLIFLGSALTIVSSASSLNKKDLA